jgi:hypothetical protein
LSRKLEKRSEKGNRHPAPNDKKTSPNPERWGMGLLGIRYI